MPSSPIGRRRLGGGVVWGGGLGKEPLGRAIERNLWEELLKGTFGFGNNTCNSYTMKQNTPFSIRIPAFHGRKLPEVGVIVGYWVVDFW